MRLLFSIFISIVFLSYSFSQTKNEKETRIELSDLPKPIKTIVEKLAEDCKRIRFYKETDGEKQSFEAKFKYRKKHYSIEFSTDGTLEDIEIETKFRRINKDVKKQIEAYFEVHFDKKKIIKIQEQFVFNKEQTAEDFINNILSEKHNTLPNYEIIAEVRKEKARDVREFLFDDNGSFVNFRIVNPTSYEHILY